MTRTLAPLVALALLLAACAPRAASGDALLAAAQQRTQPEVPAEVAPEELEVWATASGDPEALRPRPADAPDVVIIAFSGHCGLLCRAVNTWSYLDESADATDGVAVLDGIVAAFERQGLTVEAVSLSSFVEAHPSRISNEVEAGYLEGQAYLDFVTSRWIDGVEDPTRVVLVGHSHGTVWATLLAMNNLDVSFDYLVSIDAICWQWWAKHKGYISRAYVEAGVPIPFPLEQGDPCGTLAVPGQRGRFDINDVVPANVAYGLEIRTPFRLFSLDPNVLYDDDVNVRINGSTDNIWGIEATVAHNGVGRSYSPAVAWAGAMIDLLGLPAPGAFPMDTFVRPPLPTGFDYQRE